MTEKTYKVADGVTLAVRSVILKPGEKIPAGALGESAIKTLLAKKKIVEDKGGDASQSDGKKTADAGAGTQGGDQK